MAQNTNYTTQTGAPALLQKVQVYQYEVDASANNITAGDYVEMIQLEAGDVIIAGSYEVTTEDAGGGLIDIGLGGGLGLIDGGGVDAAQVNPFTNTIGIDSGGGAVTLLVATAPLTTAVILVTVAVLKGGDFRG